MIELVDLICLLYHEARNVRHPIKAGKLSNNSKYKKLINLPNNRNQAWKDMSRIREKSLQLHTAIEIKDAFQNEFDLSIEDLLQLYRKPCWKHSLYGGNKWAPICMKLLELISIFDSADENQRCFSINQIKAMEHNTGKVSKKLKDLKNSLL